jgi:hypothetical protein
MSTWPKHCLTIVKVGGKIFIYGLSLVAPLNSRFLTQDEKSQEASFKKLS